MIDLIENNIAETIEEYIDEFEVDDTQMFTIEQIIMICDTINDKMCADYHNGNLPVNVRIAATLHKWIDDEDGLGIISEEAESWDDAEELVLYMAIERPRPRKDKKYHEAIIKECMPLLTSLVSMEHFVDTCDEGVSQMCGGDYFPHESVGFFNFYKQNYYDNHKKFHGIV